MSEITKEALADNIQIIRVIRSKDWIKPDKSISREAYRPRKRPESMTGYEENVSTELRDCRETAERLLELSKRWQNKPLAQTTTTFPNERGYNCIRTSPCHVGISGDMSKLYYDFETLEYIAANSKIIFPEPLM